MIVMLGMATEDLCFCLMSKVYQCIFSFSCLRSFYSHHWAASGSSQLYHYVCGTVAVAGLLLDLVHSLFFSLHFHRVVYFLQVRRASVLDL